MSFLYQLRYSFIYFTLFHTGCWSPVSCHQFQREKHFTLQICRLRFEKFFSLSIVIVFCRSKQKLYPIAQKKLSLISHTCSSNTALAEAPGAELAKLQLRSPPATRAPCLYYPTTHNKRQGLFPPQPLQSSPYSLWGPQVSPLPRDFQTTLHLTIQLPYKDDITIKHN